MFLDGPLPGPFDIEAGARSFSRTTRTMLHRKRRLSSIDKHTGATRTFVNGLSFIQHLEKPDLIHFVIFSQSLENVHRSVVILADESSQVAVQD